MRRLSLRLRLFLLILIPLCLVAILLGVWRIMVAQRTAEDLFDRSLLAAALAISRDVAVSGGDALLPLTRDLIQDASGGEVFYHATGPRGIYVTGYAYPPIVGAEETASREPQFFLASYRGESVRVLKITERITIDAVTGDTTITVWQRLADRAAFANALAVRTAALMGGLLASLALVVWFGVGRGLRPLTDLQEAIASRSPDDLSQIKRPVPIEARGILRTVNRLFGQVEKSMAAHQSFISDAAHQLRNPAAAVQSLAESLPDARTEAERQSRTEELISASRASARVADQLLSLDRLRQPFGAYDPTSFDLNPLVAEICTELGPHILAKGIDLEFRPSEGPASLTADRVFVGEAIRNLIDNAFKHGGPNLTSILATVATDQASVSVTIRDDGKGIPPSARETAFRRFSQVEPSQGSGLGLAIAASVAERHGGALSIDTVEIGASLTLRLPVHPSA